MTLKLPEPFLQAVSCARETCHACAFEAEMGTEQVPHPLHEKLHRCVYPNPETAWDYNPLDEGRRERTRILHYALRLEQELINARRVDSDEG